MHNNKIPVFVCSTRNPKQIIEWWERVIALPVKLIKDETFWKDLTTVGITNRKLPAQLYIDDSAYKYTGQTVKHFILDNSEKMEEANE